MHDAKIAARVFAPIAAALCSATTVGASIQTSGLVLLGSALGGIIGFILAFGANLFPGAHVVALSISALCLLVPSLQPVFVKITLIMITVSVTHAADAKVASLLVLFLASSDADAACPPSGRPRPMAALCACDLRGIRRALRAGHQHSSSPRTTRDQDRRDAHTRGGRVSGVGHRLPDARVRRRKGPQDGAHQPRRPAPPPPPPERAPTVTLPVTLALHALRYCAMQCPILTHVYAL
eukprot:2080670-Rhodomonas_salina.2